MDKKIKLTIPAKQSVEDGILSIIDYLKEKERANGKSAKEILARYSFGKSYSVATLIKNFYKDEVSFAVFSTIDENGKPVEHACVVYNKKVGKTSEELYFDINGKKTRDEMKRFVARSAKTTAKNVAVRVGYFFAITNVTNTVMGEIERKTKQVKEKVQPVAVEPVKVSKLSAKNVKPATTTATKPATKSATKTATKSATKSATKTASAKPVAKKSEAKTSARATTKTAKPVAKKTETSTTTKTAKASKPATSSKSTKVATKQTKEAKPSTAKAVKPVSAKATAKTKTAKPVAKTTKVSKTDAKASKTTKATAKTSKATASKTSKKSK